MKRLNRRTLFGLPLVGLLGFWPRRCNADAAVRADAAAPVWTEPEPLGVDPFPTVPRTGPTMVQLIDLAANDPHARGDYDRLLGMAIQQIGPVAIDRSGVFGVFHSGGFPQAPFGHHITTVRKASLVPVLESLLPYFRPENRGEEFPRGVPYKPLP